MDQLVDAILNHDVGSVKKHLDANPNSIHSQDSLQYTPLHRAVWEEQLPIVSLLLDRGANVNARGPDGNTPLHYTSHPDIDPELGGKIAELLIQRGANIEARNDQGETPLLLAAMRKPQVAETLLRLGANYDLNSAVFLGDADRVRDLLKADPELRHVPFRDQLLDAAVYTRNKQLVEMLLKNGLDPNKGRPPLFSAVELALNDLPGSLDIVRLLLDSGADVTSKSDGLSLEAFVGKYPNKRAKKVVKLLKERGGAKAKTLFRDW